MANEGRLIDPEKCYCIAKAYHSDFEQNMANLHSLRELLDDCPTVDAVEVVRCKVCNKSKHSHLFGSGWRFCMNNSQHHKDDHFCSYGERREGECLTQEKS